MFTYTGKPSRRTYTDPERCGSITVVSNFKHIPIIYGFELTKKERKEMDWVKPEEFDETSFFRYGGNIYHLSDTCMSGHPDGWQFGSNRQRNRAEEDKNGPWYNWDVVSSDSFFSGIVLRWVPEEECIHDSGDIIVGRYY